MFAKRAPVVRVQLVIPIFLGCLFLSSCSLIYGGDDERGKGKSGLRKKRPAFILSRFVRISENRQGKKEWVLKAREGRFFNKKQQMFLTDFIITFYKNGRASSSLRARRGIINTRTRDITALKKVFLKSSNGRTLSTEELYGNMRSKIISNAVFNRITTEDGTILAGTHLHGRNDLRIFKLKNTVGETRESNLSNRQDSGTEKRRGTSAING